MEMSDQINELASALSRAQGQIKGASKDSSNPFFKSRYADLESIWDACRQPLTAHGLSILQSPTTETVGDTVRVSVTTLLLHSSGQWIRDTVGVAAKEDSPQAIASCITYMKRYTLQSFAGVAPTDDDDGEAATGRGGNGSKARGFAPTPAATVPAGYGAWLDDMRSVADEGTEALLGAWKQSSLDCRRHLTTNQPQLWESLKATAANVSAKHKPVAS